MKLYECKCPLGRIYIFCEDAKTALAIFRQKFVVLEVKIREVKERTWIASAECIEKLWGIGG